MFATATRNFVEEVDPDGGLVPVSSLKDSISVLSVVVKRKRFWLWQKPKYIPTDFQLNDLLTGDEPLTPGEIGRGHVQCFRVATAAPSRSVIHYPTVPVQTQQQHNNVCIPICVSEGKCVLIFCSTAFHKV